MTKIISEDAISIDSIRTQLVDCKLEPVVMADNTLRLRTSSGIGYRIGLRDEDMFVRIGTYLPLSKTRDRECKLELAHTLNEELFLPSCHIDEDGHGDLWINYAMSYKHGLITDQLIDIVHRFDSMLEYIVNQYNDDGLIDFTIHSIVNNDGPSLPAPIEGTTLIH